MGIAGIREAGASVDAIRMTSLRPATPPVRSSDGGVRLVARIASAPAAIDAGAPLDALPPSDSSPARTAARTRAWLNETLDPLDRYVDGYPVEHDPAPAPAPASSPASSSPLGADGVLA